MGPLRALPDGCNFKVLISLGLPAAGEGLVGEPVPRRQGLGPRCEAEKARGRPRRRSFVRSGGDAGKENGGGVLLRPRKIPGRDQQLA